MVPVLRRSLARAVSCVWCGRPCDAQAACFRCAPEQGKDYEPEEYGSGAPAPELAERLAEVGAQPIELPPDEPEWFDLNEERFLHALHERK